MGREAFLQELRDDHVSEWSAPLPEPRLMLEDASFLGQRVRLKWHPQFGLMPRIEIPKHKQADLRYRVKQETRRGSLPRSPTDVSRRSIGFCAAGSPTISPVRVLAPFSTASITISGTGCAAGNSRTI